MNLWAVLLTGLFAGGVSCPAAQGGLLAGMIARRTSPSSPRSADPRQGATDDARSALSRPALRVADDLTPVLGFLAGKLVSHVLLGAVLGLAGQVLQVSVRVRGALQIAAGLVMVAMAADLLGFRAVHRLIPAPPPRWAALVKRNAKSRAALAPAVLGFLTFLIPCGVTLSVELLAIASGSAVRGALIMGAFVVGTSPLFAVLGYVLHRASAAGLGKLAGAGVLAIGVVTLNGGLVLVGSPLAFPGIGVSRNAASSPQPSDEGPSSSQAPATPAASAGSVDRSATQRLLVNVRSVGYSPQMLKARAGLPTMLTLRTNRTSGCTQEFVVPALGYEEILPETGETTVDLGVLPKGGLAYTCGMGMYRGFIDAG